MATQTLANDKNNPDAIQVDNSYSIFKVFLIGAIVIAVSVVGFNFYQSGQDTSRAELGDQLFKFETNVLTPFLDKKEGASIEAVITEFNKLFDHQASKAGALSSDAIKVSDILIDNKKTDEAASILKKALVSANDDMAKYFISTRLAVLEQNRGNIDEAIKLNEKLLTQKINFLTEKTYFDLGVLYMKKGNTEKAKSSFNYVIEKSKDETLLKLARLYLN